VGVHGREQHRLRTRGGRRHGVHRIERRPVYAFSRAGERQWRIETNGVVGSVVAGDDLLYAANNERLFAIERA
jgi:hypothetical protein